MARLCELTNESAVALGEVPVLLYDGFREEVLQAVERGGRIASYFGCPSGDKVRLYALIANDRAGSLSAVAADVGDEFPSLTPDCPQAHWFEREIAEQWGIRPLGHPWLKPIRFHHSYREGHDVWGRDSDAQSNCARSNDARSNSAQSECGVTDFFRVEGEEIHEVAVGPVHAGIIEPGHFRFQCHGEDVFHLEISLGYQHRGIERRLMAGSDARTIHLMETLAGDTTVGHAMAYCQAMGALAHCSSVPPRAMALRGIALELERIANHVGDLGALAGDVGYLPTMSYCGRIRGDVLNATALLCGNRFGRGIVRPGGCGVDVDPPAIDDLHGRLETILKDVTVAVNLLWDTPSVTARFEDTGIVSPETCEEIGLVGPAARACGCERDVRKDHPFGIYRFAHIPTQTWPGGDVFARAQVRWLEIQRSIAFIQEQLLALPSGPVKADIAAPAPNRLAVSLTEGWRGEICHVAITDGDGKLARYKIVDPSFHNWFGLAMSLRNQQISDFPLCNKSFNLSYCGHDL